MLPPHSATETVVFGHDPFIRPCAAEFRRGKRTAKQNQPPTMRNGVVTAPAGTRIPVEPTALLRDEVRHAA